MDDFSRSAKFLTMAKAAAKRTGYDSSKLELANDGKHKLLYRSPDGIKRFGALGYGDFLYYSTHEPANAAKKRSAYRARAKATADAGGKNSPAALAFNILW